MVKDTGLELVEVQKLNLGDRLLEASSSDLFVSSIKHINEPITAYNLLSIAPDSNFYANGILVHNKGGGGGSGSSGGYLRSGGGGYTSALINKKTLPKLMLVIAILVLGLLPFAFLDEIYNLFRFWDRKFTDDSELINFTKNVNSKFTNSYSTRYSEDDEIWVAAPSSEEVDENAYQNLISKSELIEQMRLLFVRYQHDWAHKNFAGMTEYIAKPFYKEQYDISVKSFGKNFDIVYKPELYEVVPISYRAKEGKSVFRVQINGQMVNFKISRQGFILSGKAYPRSFTEYWDIEVDTAKQLYLLDISQTSK